MTRTEHVFFLLLFSALLCCACNSLQCSFMSFASHSFSFCPVSLLHHLSLCTYTHTRTKHIVVCTAVGVLPVHTQTSESVSFLYIEFCCWSFALNDTNIFSILLVHCRSSKRQTTATATKKAFKRNVLCMYIYQTVLFFVFNTQRAPNKMASHCYFSCISIND